MRKMLIHTDVIQVSDATSQIDGGTACQGAVNAGDQAGNGAGRQAGR